MKKTLVKYINLLVYTNLLLIILSLVGAIILSTSNLARFVVCFWLFVVIFIILLGTLVLYWLHIKPSLWRTRKLLSDFASGKTDNLVFGKKNIVAFPESYEFIAKVNEMIGRENQLMITRQKAELRALQNQINPHFLYNTLETLRDDAVLNGNETMVNVVQSLSDLFRYSVSNNSIVTTAENEIKNMEDYFTIQKYRFDKKMQMRIDYIGDKSQIYKLLIPRLTLQPIIENSITLGLETNKGYGFIKVIFEVTDTLFLIHISDNGLGIDDRRLDMINKSVNETPFSKGNTVDIKTEHYGIGLQNIAQRIKLIFGEAYGLTVYSKSDVGTNVEIILPKLNSMESIDNGRY